MPPRRPAGAAATPTGREASREQGAWAAGPAWPASSRRHSQRGLRARRAAGVGPWEGAASPEHPLPAQRPPAPLLATRVWLHVEEGAPGCPSAAGGPALSSGAGPTHLPPSPVGLSSQSNSCDKNSATGQQPGSGPCQGHLRPACGQSSDSGARQGSAGFIYSSVKGPTAAPAQVETATPTWPCRSHQRLPDCKLGRQQPGRAESGSGSTGRFLWPLAWVGRDSRSRLRG